MITVVQIFDWAYYYWNSYGRPEFISAQPTLQEMINMSWQALVAGGKGLIYYGYWELMQMDDINPFEDVWKNVIELTEHIWKYKDIILSIDEIKKIEFAENLNVTFRQWKYNKTNYIVVVNLEREKEIFKIDLLDKYKIVKEFGLGNYKKKWN